MRLRRVPPLARVAATAVAVAACGDPLGPLPGERPRELTYAVDGGLFGTVTDLRLAGDTVVLVSRAFGPQGESRSVTRRVPSAADWRGFARAAGAAGVRRWPGACRDDRIADGGGFSYTLTWDQARYAGSYYVQSPTAAGRCSGTDRADAQAFGRAVLSLAGVMFVD